MTKLFTMLGVLLIAGGLAYHFAALEIFNALVPKDKDSILHTRDMAYGAHPRQKLDIYLPRESSGRLPMVVFVHGGNWQKGNKHPYGFVGRALAAQGFMALVIDYRLHPEHTYPAFVDDVAMALRWAADNAQALNGDATKLFAMGHSAGAYNVAMAALDKRVANITPKLAGVVTLAGPFDFVPLDSPVTIEVFGKLKELASSQPINHMRADAPPFLILHGDADTTVFPRNAKGLQAAFERAGQQVEIKMYPGISHVDILLALSTWKRESAPVLQDAVAFMKDRAR